MLVNKNFSINSDIITDADKVSFTREFSKNLVSEIAAIDKKRTRLIGSALYAMARKQANLVSGVNYAEANKILKDSMGRSDILEIVGTLRDYQDKGTWPGATPEEVDQYYAESTSGDYDNLLRVATQWVNVN